jgi:hypothetical protein
MGEIYSRERVEQLAAAMGAQMGGTRTAWVGDGQGNVNAVDDTDVPNTIYIRVDTPDNNVPMIAYVDILKFDLSKLVNNLCVKVRPYYADRPAVARIRWTVDGADELVVGVQMGNLPPDPAGGWAGTAKHDHGNDASGGKLDLDVAVDAGTLALDFGGTGSNLSGTGEGTLIQASIGAPVTILKHNFAATSNPTTSDDDVAGYAVGSVWINVSSGAVFTCVDATTNAAVWASGGPSLPLAVGEGGTGLTSVAAGALLVGTNTSPMATLAVGSNGQVLRVVSGSPAWVTPVTTIVERRVLLQTVVTSGTPTSITFSSISGTYNHLLIKFIARANNGLTDDLLIAFNADTNNANYQYITNVSNTNTNNQRIIGTVTGASASSNEYAQGEIMIPFYTFSGARRQAHANNAYFVSGTIGGAIRRTVNWRNTATITQIQIALAAEEFVDDCLFELWGIDSGPVVTGFSA